MEILDKLLHRIPIGHGPRMMRYSFTELLDKINSKYSIEEEPDEQLCRIVFDYQGGHFIAIIKDSNVGVEVMYPCITEKPVEEFNLVRQICNDFNGSTTALKCVYGFDAEVNKLRLHISFFCNTVEERSLTSLLSACFFYQRQIDSEYDKCKAQQGESATEGDLESHINDVTRERFLVARQEMILDATSDGHGWHANATSRVELGTFIDKALGLKSYKPSQLTVVHDGTAHPVADDEIEHWDLSRLLIDGEGQDAILSRDNAVAIVTLQVADVASGDIEARHRVLTIAAVADGSDDKSLYMRLTACLTARSISRTNSLSAPQLAASVTVLMAYDRISDLQREQEFDYMWHDARLKIRDGEDLSPEQQLIFDIARANIAYNLYWGKKMMLSERYYQALLHFENAYHDMLPEFFKLNEDMKKTFLEICFHIGMCYNQLHQYDRAFYYLQLFEGDHSVRSFSQWVNCLSNGHDVRVFKAIDECMGALNERYHDIDEVPENLMPFVNMLRRQRASSFIYFNELDEAEKMLKPMLEEPDNSDYATSALAHIDAIRKNWNKSQETLSDDNATAQNSTENNATH